MCTTTTKNNNSYNNHNIFHCDQITLFSVKEEEEDIFLLDICMIKTLGDRSVASVSW
jgi:hypothetical protein